MGFTLLCLLAAVIFQAFVFHPLVMLALNLNQHLLMLFILLKES